MRHVLGRGLLTERQHECAVAVVVGARALLHHWLREAEGLRADRPAHRVTGQHDRVAAREPDLDRPRLDISRHPQENGIRGLADGDRERGGRGAGAMVVGGGGIAGAPPRRHEDEQKERAGHARPEGRPSRHVNALAHGAVKNQIASQSCQTRCPWCMNEMRSSSLTMSTLPKRDASSAAVMRRPPSVAGSSASMGATSFSSCAGLGGVCEKAGAEAPSYASSTMSASVRPPPDALTREFG